MLLYILFVLGKDMKEITKYKLNTTIRYFGDAFFYPFFALYLVNSGHTEAKIGFILSITPIIAIIANPIYSRICQDVKTTKKVLSIITVLEAIIIIAISFSHNFYLISVLVTLLALFGSSHYGLLDSLTAIYANETKINYTSIRIFGSIAYIVATTLGGFVIQYLGFQVCFAIACLSFVTSGFMYLLLKPIELTEEEKERPKEKFKYSLLFKNKDFVFYALFYVVMIGTTVSGEAFFPTYLESRGITSNQYGLIFSYFVFFEVITIIILNKYFKKANYHALLAVYAVLTSTRLLVNFLYLPVFVVILFSAFRGIANAIILFGSFHYIIKMVGEKKITMAYMLMVFLQSIYVAIFNNINGNIIEIGSYKTFYLVNLLISLLIVLFAIFRIVYYRKKEAIC